MFVGALHALIFALAPVPNEALTLECARSPAAAYVELQAEPLHFAYRVPEPAWLELTESGQQVAVDAPEARVVPMPLRFGTHIVRLGPGPVLISVSRAQQNRAPGGVLLKLHCETEGEAEPRLEWWIEAARIASQLKQPLAADEVDNLLIAIRELRRSAMDSALVALASHMEAQLLLIGGRNRSAADAFKTAEDLWRAARDGERALVARVARVEDLIRAGQFKTAVRDADERLSSQPEGYFMVRLRAAKCVALDSLGRSDQAAACYKRVSSQLKRLDERTEFANVVRNYAVLLHHVGNDREGEKYARLGLTDVTGPDAALVRGRIRLTLADIAIGRGDVPSAIRELDASVREFDTSKSSRASTMAMLRMSYLYGEIGAYEEAYRTLGQAMAKLSIRDAPVLFANALMQLSDMERDLGRYAGSLWLANVARRIYFDHGMTKEAEDAILAAVHARLLAGDAKAAGRELDRLSTTSAHRWLLESAAALDSHDAVQARTALDKLDTQTLSLRDRVRLARSRAQYLLLMGNPHAAGSTLFRTATRMVDLAELSSSATLRYLLERQIDPLRREGIKLALAEPLVDLRAELVWKWLEIGRTPPHPKARRIDPRLSANIDRAIADDLLGDGAPDRPNQHDLFSLLATGGVRAGGQESSRLSLAGLMSALGANDAFLALVDAGDNEAVFWATRSGADVYQVGDMADIASHVSAMKKGMSSPEETVETVARIAQAISERLLPRVLVPPENLYVLSSPLASNIAWSTLRWPGLDAALLRTTSVTLVDAVDEPARTGSDAERVLHVVSASIGEDRAWLQRLPNANVEAALIRSIVGRGYRVEETRNATRRQAIAILEDREGWVHIASHGSTQPGRLGYSGVWLDPENGELDQGFLSWLDILENGVTADMVVLDSCAVGASGSPGNESLSFANALARAGAGRVIAPQWAISDAAMATWVSGFYSSLLRDSPQDPSRALRVAQLRLRDSRAFRHPYYWAGLMSFGRFPERRSGIAPPSDQPQAKQAPLAAE